MKCQLARILECTDEEWEGLLIWVCQEHPLIDVFASDVRTGDVGIIPRAVRLALLADTGQPLLADLDILELLPHFADVEPVHYDHWVTKRGEQLPHTPAAGS